MRRTTHPRDVHRRRGHRPTLRPSHRPPQQLLRRLVRHRPRGTRTTRHRDLTRQAADVGQRVTSDGFAGGHRRQRTQRRRRPAPSAKSAIPHRTTAGNKGQKWQSWVQTLPTTDHQPSPSNLPTAPSSITGCPGARHTRHLHGRPFRQPHPAALGRITLGPTRANKSYNPTYQPGASPTG